MMDVAEDRVVTTDFLLGLNQELDCDYLQLGRAVLERLETDAFHVLVPTGHTHGANDMKVVCRAVLAAGGDEPLIKEVLIAPMTFESLPTAFSVLSTTRELVPMAVREVDQELEAIRTETEVFDFDLAGDEDDVAIDVSDSDDSDDDGGV